MVAMVQESLWGIHSMDPVKVVTFRFDRESHFLGRLTKFPQTGTVDEFIVAFE